MKEIKTVQAYSIMEFTQVVADHIKQGYEVDVDDVKTCPVAYGNLYEIGFVKVTKETKSKKTKEEKEEKLEELKPEVTPETPTE